jgi:hypothetical protein
MLQAAPLCSATAPARAPTVVELYTSEGCSSCPPADQWLAALPRGESVLAMAFHVDYWDHLGWPDRFASPAHTARQYALQAGSGARFVYTPQVIVNGRDWPAWRQAGALPAPAAAAVGLRLIRDGKQVRAEVGMRSGPGALAGYWALVEDAHRSQASTGENAGRELRHEHVVRRFSPVAPWAAVHPQALTWEPAVPEAGHPAQVVFVVTDAATARPLQAARLPVEPGC